MFCAILFTILRMLNIFVSSVYKEGGWKHYLFIYLLISAGAIDWQPDILRYHCCTTHIKGGISATAICHL